MPKYPWLPRSVYVQRVGNVKQLRPWSSFGIQVHAKDGDCETVGTVKQSR